MVSLIAPLWIKSSFSGIFIESHDGHLAAQIQAMQSFRRARSARSFQADDAVEFIFAVRQLGNLIVGLARITLIVDGGHNFYSRKFLQRVVDAFHALIKVQLSGNADNRHPALALQQLRHAAATLLARAEIIGTDK